MTETLPQISLVTGGNRGLGLEAVKSILEADPTNFVFLGCRDLEAGRALTASLEQTYGHRVEALQVDVGDAISIAKAAEVVGASKQRLDILVNNAGILLDAESEQVDMQAVRKTMQINFHGVVAVTEAFLPLLLKSPGRGQILSTSSGCGTRAMGLVGPEIRETLLDVNLDEATLHKILTDLTDSLQDPNSSTHSIPTVGYSLSKLGVNCFTQILSRKHPELRVNACSPGFCNTGMCANYTGERKPKDPALGASVFGKVLFGELGQGKTGTFFKEASKPDTPLDKAVSVAEPWVALKEK